MSARQARLGIDDARDLDLQNAAERLTGNRHSKPSSRARPRPARREAETPQRSQPRRVSSRLQGLEADSEVAKRKAEEEEAQRREEQAALKRRRTDEYDLRQADAQGLSTESLFSSLANLDEHGARAVSHGVKKEEEEADEARGAHRAADRQVKMEPGIKEELEDADGLDGLTALSATRDDLAQLRLYPTWEPNEIRITPDRIYSMAMHPTVDKRLVFAGDKSGYMGTWDVDGGEEEGIGRAKESRDDADGAEPGPRINQFRIHTRPVTAIVSEPTDMTKLYTASYDCSIRTMDLVAARSYEVYGPAELDDNSVPISSIDVRPEGNVIVFSSLHGHVGIKDVRERGVHIFPLQDRKIGTVSLHPRQPHLLASASLDRTLSLWDIRNAYGAKTSAQQHQMLAQYTSSKSISSAYWNSAGSIVATSYDDTLGIFSGIDGLLGKSTRGRRRSEQEEQTLTIGKPTYSVRHNNQTGRWLTVFKAQWQRNPLDNVQKIVCGNMNR